MSTAHPSPVPPSDGEPHAPLWQRARAAVRRVLHDVVHDLTTPAEPPRAPLAPGERRWLRRLPYFLLGVLTAILLRVTGTMLTNGYGLHPAASGALAITQVTPLLLAVRRPLQAWWIIFPADVVGAFALLTVPDQEQPWPWTPMVIIGYLALSLALGLREGRRTLVTIWLLSRAAGALFELISQDRSDGSPVLLFVLGGIMLLVGGTVRESRDAQRRLAEVETISKAERARRTLLEERAHRPRAARRGGAPHVGDHGVGGQFPRTASRSCRRRRVRSSAPSRRWPASR